jgi:signal transduction histidine kinase
VEVNLMVRFQTLQGRQVWGHLAASLVRSAAQEPEYWVLMVQDIDGRKRAEEALRLSEERYRMLFAAGSDAILVYDLHQGGILEANPSAEELFGRSTAELQQQKITDLFAQQQPVGCEKVELLAAIVRDITERQKLEAVKDDMLSSVSHEMRTPLTAMLGFAEFLLNNDASAEQQREYLEIIYQESLRLKELIDNLLNLQRLRAGFGLARVEPVSLQALLYDAVALFAPKYRQHRFEVACADDLPLVQADVGQLFQMLRNLVSNAVKYSPAGGLVRLTAVASGDGVRLTVRDEGLGIPPAALERIFDRFYRVTSNGHQRIGGTGLGLPLVREIVGRHGGRVWAESVYGQGSSFIVELPLTQAADPPPAERGPAEGDPARPLLH